MTITYNNVYIKESSTVAGKIESEGPLSKYFDKTYDDFYMNEDSFEKGEIKMILDNTGILLNKSKLNKNDIDLFISGDLTNQITPSSYAAEKLGINYMGIYAACASSCLSIIVGASMLQNGEVNKCICNVSSNNSAAEKQYRNPVEYGTPKPSYSTFTATGSASVLLSKEKSKIRVESVTIGSAVDYGINDAFNMGAAMAPAAALTLSTHLKDKKRDVNYYDLILTGDLGLYGKEIFKDLMKIEHDIKIDKNYNDCGVMLFDLEKQDVNAGASGTTSSALVTYGYILNKMKKGELKKVLLLATGALMSPTMMNQKMTIPAICHAVSLEAL